jgi:hypothetical protein
MRSIYFMVLFTLVLASPSFAGDGVREINQTCAAQTGCFAGDTAGFPVTITESGSYILTSSLAVGSFSSRGIEITTSEVSLDLNGFAITNDVTCSGAGSTLSCGASGSTQHGIDAPGQAGVAIRNGIIRGFAADGIRVGDYAKISAIHSEQNGGSGIVTGNYALVTDSTAAINNFEGVTVGLSSEVSGVTARSNRTDGITADDGSVVKKVRAWDNGVDGVDLDFGVVITDSTSYINEGDGIDTRGGCLVRGNVVYANGPGGSGYQLRTQTNSAYVDNVFRSSTNHLGFVVGGLNTGGNVCDGVLCP